MAELDEEQGLIRKSLQGDHAAFEALIMCHQRMVHSLTYRMTGSLADAEDLAQETFIQAFRQLANYCRNTKLSACFCWISARLLIFTLFAAEVGGAFGVARSNSPTNSEKPLRVALMNFICEDNSARSTEAALNFTTALQAHLSADPLHQWVERADLEKAEKELHLAGFGQTDRSEAIQSGRWVKADWAVFGTISTNTAAGRTVHLEIVDLGHAEELVETNVALAPQTGRAFQVASTDEELVYASLSALLKEADGVAARLRNQTTAALLFFTPSFPASALVLNKDDLQREFETMATSGSPVHFLRLERTGESLDEACLAINGFVESDPHAWEKVADVYLWGTYTANSSKSFDPKSRRFIDETTTTISLHAWNGRTEPRLVQLTITNDVSPQSIARKLAQAALPLLARSTEPVVEGTRQRVAASLLEQYRELLRFNPNLEMMLGSPEGRRNWLGGERILATACFFDPANAAVREQYLRMRWGQFVSFEVRNEFAFARRRSDGWGKYVNEFGFKSMLPKAAKTSIAAEYVLSAWRPFEMFSYALENQQQWGIPRDVGATVLTEWRNQFGSEFISRRLAAPDDPEFSTHLFEFFYKSLGVDDAGLRSKMIAKLRPQILDAVRKQPVEFDTAYAAALKRHFDAIGQPDEYQKLMAQWEEARTKGTAAPPPEQKVDLPRFSQMDAEKPGDLFVLPVLKFLPPLPQPTVQRVPFPKAAPVKGVKLMMFQDGVLWLAVDTAETVKIEDNHERVDKDLPPVMADRTILWRLDQSGPNPQPVNGPLATHQINSMFPRSNELWLALNDDGIAVLNPKNGQVRRFEAAAGVTFTNAFAVADFGRGVAALGGMSGLISLENGTDNWKDFSPSLPHQGFSYGGSIRRLAASPNWALLYNGSLLLCNLLSNNWTRLADLNSMNKMGRISLMTVDERGHFWFSTDAGLHELNPVDGKLRSQWISISPEIRNTPPPGIPETARTLFQKSGAGMVGEIRRVMGLRHSSIEMEGGTVQTRSRFVPASRLPGAVTAIAPDGEFLWLLTRSALLLYHPASKSFAGGFSLDAQEEPLALACGGANVWVATRKNLEVSLLKMDTTALKATPREHWIPDAISGKELAAQLAALPPRERAVYDFFAGDDEAFIRQLSGANEESLDAQSLFLLTTAEAELGQTARAAHLKEVLQSRFPGSVFTKALRPESPSTSPLNRNFKPPL